MSNELLSLYICILRLNYTIKSCLRKDGDWIEIQFNSEENKPIPGRVMLFENDFYQKYILGDEWTK